ncbi:MAG: CHAT domain-containing protein, partial [Acidobacteriota bacterium]
AAIEPFAGVASALVLGGLPAVLAMQIPISDQAAIAFSRDFYAELAAGTTLDEALVEGRQAIENTDSNSVEWGTPVLFLRVKDGNVFDRAETPIVEHSPDPAPPPQSPYRRWIAIGAVVSAVVTGGIALDPARMLGSFIQPSPEEVHPNDLRDQAPGEKAVEVEDTKDPAPERIDPVPVATTPKSTATVPGGQPTATVPGGNGEGNTQRRTDANEAARQPEAKTTSTQELVKPPPKTAPPSLPPADPAPSKAEFSFSKGPWSINDGDIPITTSVDGFRGKITKYELRPNGLLRCHLQLHNASSDPVRFGFDLENTRLSDNVGGTSILLHADGDSSLLNTQTTELPVNAYSSHWFDFTEPLEGSTQFTLWLSTPDELDLRFNSVRLEFEG